MIFKGCSGAEQQASLGARCVTLEEFLLAELKAGQLIRVKPDILTF
jgi:hypothetical protein